MTLWSSASQCSIAHNLSTIQKYGVTKSSEERCKIIPSPLVNVIDWRRISDEPTVKFKKNQSAVDIGSMLRHIYMIMFLIYDDIEN
jgi:hypothetical protein